MPSEKRNASARADELNNISTRSKSGAKNRKGQGRKTNSGVSEGGTRDGAKSQRRTKKKKGTKSRRGVAIAIILAALVVTFFALFRVDVVTTNAMKPTLSEGDVVLSLREFASDHKEIGARNGGVYVLDVPERSNEPNFLRVLTCGRSKVAYTNDVLTLNDVPLGRLLLTNPAIERPDSEPDIWRETLVVDGNKREWRIMLPRTPIVGSLQGVVTVMDDQCFLVGDNRMGSYDSRHVGVMDHKKCVGKALIILKSTEDNAILGHYIKLI